MTEVYDQQQLSFKIFDLSDLLVITEHICLLRTMKSFKLVSVL
jgi:hypothetical protein